MRIVQIALLAGLSILSTLAGGHGGGLDANGCHHVRKTREYNRHQSRRAHVVVHAARTLHDGHATPVVGICGAKRYCTQMTSCEESVFYFADCGVSRLDGDSDGVPCEKLCGNH